MAEQLPRKLELLSEEQAQKLAFKSAPLTDRDITRATKRIKRARRKAAWRLWEACDIAFGVIPIKELHWILAHSLDAEDLCDCAISAVQTGELVVLNKEGDPRDWWVRRQTFQKWVVHQEITLGKPRAEFLRMLYAEDIGADVVTTRERILHSDFSTALLDAAFEAIAHFWLPNRNGAPRPTREEVEEWLIKNHACAPSAAAEIARIINPYPGTTKSTKK